MYVYVGYLQIHIFPNRYFDTTVLARANRCISAVQTENRQKAKSINQQKHQNLIINHLSKLFQRKTIQNDTKIIKNRPFLTFVESTCDEHPAEPYIVVAVTSCKRTASTTCDNIRVTSNSHRTNKKDIMNATTKTSIV